MTRLVVGVIGHVDHGKTALVRALTGQDTDRLPEEKQRGISIALGFAHLTAGHADIDLIDMPGHERFVRTMIAGATGIDAVLLVLAANEGIKPQTVEHVDIAGLLGLRQAVVAISKLDLVTLEQASLVADEAVALLAKSGIAARPPVMTSALRGTGIDELRQALGILAAQQRPRAADGVAFLPIDRAFSVAGHGPVVTGTLRGGAVAVGDALELAPLGSSVRVRAVQVHGARVDMAAPGQRVALNLRDIDIADLRRGMALGAPDTLVLSDWLTMSIRAVDGAPPLKNGMRLRAMLGTDEVDVRLRLLDRDVLAAGEFGFAQLHGSRAVAPPAREPVLLRIASPAQTVAGGLVLEPETRRLRRRCPAILARLEELRVLPPAEMIEAELQRNAAAGSSVRRLAQLSALAAPRVEALLQALPVVVSPAGAVVRQVDIDDLVERVPELLQPLAAGLAQDKLLAALPGVGAAVLDAALGRLLARGVVARRGGQLLVPRLDEEQARARTEVELAAYIAETLRRAGLAPPSPSEIVTDLLAKRAVDRLLREGVLIRAVERGKGREILFHQDAIEAAQRLLTPLLERVGGVLVTEVGAALGISRKYSMPLLDHLDTIRFTRRINDRRILGTRPPSMR